MTLVHPNDVVPSEAQPHLLIQSIYATQDPKQVGHALVGAYPIGDQVVPGHSTHRKPHSPFYEDNHRNDNFPFFSMGVPITQRVVPQGDTLGNVVQGLKPLHTYGGIY